MKLTSKSERQNYRPRDEGDARPRHQPFDTSAIEKLPFPDENDPPYRPFWVTDGNE